MPFLFSYSFPFSRSFRRCYFLSYVDPHFILYIYFQICAASLSYMHFKIGLVTIRSWALCAFYHPLYFPSMFLGYMSCGPFLFCTFPGAFAASPYYSPFDIRPLYVYPPHLHFECRYSVYVFRPLLYFSLTIFTHFMYPHLSFSPFVLMCRIYMSYYVRPFIFWPCPPTYRTFPLFYFATRGYFRII